MICTTRSRKPSPFTSSSDPAFTQLSGSQTNKGEVPSKARSQHDGGDERRQAACRSTDIFYHRRYVCRLTSVRYRPRTAATPRVVGVVPWQRLSPHLPGGWSATFARPTQSHVFGNEETAL